MYCLALALVLAASSDVATPKLGRMSIVVDQALARQQLRSHGVTFDDVFTVRRPEANKVRAAVIPYLRAQVRESAEQHRPYYQTILGDISHYHWHCAGHAYKGQRRLFCMAVSPAIEHDVVRFQDSAARGLPTIYDGGIAILNILFDVDRCAVQAFSWNGEA
jgi:hypothetical protein